MKSGLDYFPLEVSDDRNVRLIKAEYGLVGYSVIVELWKYIYREEGYYGVWNKDVSLLFAREQNAGDKLVSEVVSAAIKRNIFDKGIFDAYGVLTSYDIQKRYIEACSRRKCVNVIKQYLLIGVSEIPANVNILSENVHIFQENVYIPEQSKVKESKVNESNNICASADAERVRKDSIDEMFKAFWEAYPKKKSKGDALKAWRRLKPDKALFKEIMKAVSVQKRSEQWISSSGQFIPYPATWLNRRNWEDEEITASDPGIPSETWEEWLGIDPER